MHLQKQEIPAAKNGDERDPVGQSLRWSWTPSLTSVTSTGKPASCPDVMTSSRFLLVINAKQTQPTMLLEPFCMKSPPHRDSPFESLSLQLLSFEAFALFTLCACISGSLWSLKPSNSPSTLFLTMWKSNFWKRSDF